MPAIRGIECVIKHQVDVTPVVADVHYQVRKPQRTFRERVECKERIVEQHSTASVPGPSRGNGSHLPAIVNFVAVDVKGKQRSAARICCILETSSYI